jgi:hypothetical protein
MTDSFTSVSAAPSLRERRDGFAECAGCVDADHVVNNGHEGTLKNLNIRASKWH